MKLSSNQNLNFKFKTYNLSKEFNVQGNLECSNKDLNVGASDSIIQANS